MLKFSTNVSTLALAVSGLTPTGIRAAIDGSISAVSSDPGILSVATTEDGSFVATRNGIGAVAVTFSADADLGDGVRTIEKVVEFEFYDAADEADHLDVSVSVATLTDAQPPAVAA